MVRLSGFQLQRNQGRSTKLKGSVPPTFLYLMCLMLWVACACLVWFAAGLMCLTTGTRALAKKMCLAMAGTFPFVFTYQLIAAPFIAVLLFFASSFSRFLEPGTSTMTENPFVIVVSILALLLSLVAAFTASAAGFYEGWRAGWMYGNGRTLREILAEVSVLERIRLLLGSAI